MSSHIRNHLPDAAVVRQVIQSLEQEKKEGEQLEFLTLEVRRANQTWEWETVEELLHDLDNGNSWAIVTIAACLIPGKVFDPRVTIRVQGRPEPLTYVKIQAEDHLLVGRINRVISDSVTGTKEFAPRKVEEVAPKIFIGHGRSEQWRLLKDHLQESHHLQVRAFESGSRAGHTIRDILDSELDRSNFAFIVMTGEDAQGDGGLRARQNVVHEAGLFQGRLGFDRAIILLEEGVEEFSNVAGVQYIPFSRGNIRESFGDAVAAVKQAFGI